MPHNCKQEATVHLHVTWDFGLSKQYGTLIRLYDKVLGCYWSFHSLRKSDPPKHYTEELSTGAVALWNWRSQRMTFKQITTTFAPLRVYLASSPPSPMGQWLFEVTPIWKGLLASQWRQKVSISSRGITTFPVAKTWCKISCGSTTGTRSWTIRLLLPGVLDLSLTGTRTKYGSWDTKRQWIKYREIPKSYHPKRKRWPVRNDKICSSIDGDSIGRSSSLNKSLSALFKNLPLDPILAIDFVVWEHLPPDSTTMAAADFCKSATDVAPRPKFASAWSAQAVDPRPSRFTSSSPAWAAVAVLEFGKLFRILVVDEWMRLETAWHHSSCQHVFPLCRQVCLQPWVGKWWCQLHAVFLPDATWACPQHITNSCVFGWMAKILM